MALVVIVDDQAINLKILGRFAQAVGPDVTVRTFESPLAALDLLAVETPDLVVTDFVMPPMSGEEFILKVRAAPGTRDVPIIAVTAYEDREYRYRALEAGASDFLLSPVDGQEFCTRARNLLTLRRYQLSLKSRATVLEDELAASERQRLEDARRRERHLRRVVNTVPALIRASDQAGHIVFLNSWHGELFDCDWRAAAGLMQEQLLDPAYARRHSELDRQVLETGQPLLAFEETVVDREGLARVLLTSKSPLRDDAGAVHQVVTTSLDITQRKQVEQDVRDSEERFRSLVEGSVMGIVIEAAGRPVFANRTYARIFGFDEPDDVLALDSLEKLFAPGERHRLRRLGRADDGSPVASGPHEFQCLRRDGLPIWVEVLTQEVVWKGERALQSTVNDVSLRKAYEERLHRQANFDEITGLPNRGLALDRLRSAVVTAVRHHHRGGVLFIDLDQFKKINDTWGHAVGDQLLRMAAERIRECVREEDTVARLGGDEFTVILPNIASASHTEPVILKILDAFSRPFLVEGHDAFVTASIGVSVFPDDSDDPAVLMQHADAAMYRAKEEGRNTYQCFTPDLNAKAVERMRVEGNLLHALDRDEFILHFQPIVDVRSRQVAGAEALLRWASPNLGHFPPDRFVPLAEDTGLIVPVGRWILDAACRQLARWRRAGLMQMGLSVNVSFRQLRGKGLVEAVSQALLRHNVPPHCLELEITEGCLMTDLDETSSALQSLDRLGVRLALDDFGTGYSCLSYLKQLPVDTVKIDKSFILNVYNDPGDATVVEAIIAMAHRLGIRVICEGVETDEHLAFIRLRGCDLAQGFYFSPPLPADAFYDWCRTWPKLHRRAL